MSCVGCEALEALSDLYISRTLEGSIALRRPY